MRARAIVIENVDYANTLDKVGHFSNAVYADWVENTRQELEESRRAIRQIVDEERARRDDIRQWLEAD